MNLNVDSINKRLYKLNLYIAELKRQQPVSKAEFLDDFGLQLIVERAFQAAIEHQG